MRLCGTTRLYSGYNTAGGIPSTCLQDVVLISLPTWLLLLVLPLILVMSTQVMPVRDPPRSRKSKLHALLTTLYMILLFATLLMGILEIARLALADRGIGLLPFSLVGLLVALGLRLRVVGSMRSPARLLLMGFWILSVVMVAVKTGTLVALQGREERTGTKYPAVDQVTDIAVLLALYIILLCLEIIQFRRLPKENTRVLLRDAEALHMQNTDKEHGT